MYQRQKRQNGEVGPKLFERTTVVEEYPAEWSKPMIYLDYNELVRVKAKYGYTNVQLAKHFKVGLTKLKRVLKRKIVQTTP